MHSSGMRTARSSSRRGGGGGVCVCLSACWDHHPPSVGLETPPHPQVWAWRHPLGQTPQLSPWVWAWKPARHAGISPPPPRDLQGMLGHPPSP